MADAILETVPQAVIDGAIKEVSKRNPQGTDFNILSIKNDFIDGDLITVGFTEPERGKVLNYAYYHSRRLDIYKNESQFIDDLALQGRKLGFVQTLLKPDNVTGIIALAILACIAGVLIHSPDDPKVPDVLSSGLALILGFYFGKKSS